MLHSDRPLHLRHHCSHCHWLALALAVVEVDGARQEAAVVQAVAAALPCPRAQGAVAAAVVYTMAMAPLAAMTAPSEVPERRWESDITVR